MHVFRPGPLVPIQHATDRYLEQVAEAWKRRDAAGITPVELRGVLPNPLHPTRCGQCRRLITQGAYCPECRL